VSLSPEPIGPVPVETARVARGLPQGNLYVQLRDVLGVGYQDADFAGLFRGPGATGGAPLAVGAGDGAVLQFAEGLSDRQAAEAVQARIDWKHAPGLDLTDAGFDFSVLGEFRARLVAGGAEQQLLDALLAACAARGYLKASGRQRTDSTHLLGVLRRLNRL
jgi:transposase